MAGLLGLPPPPGSFQHPRHRTERSDVLLKQQYKSCLPLQAQIHISADATRQRSVCSSPHCERHQQKWRQEDEKKILKLSVKKSGIRPLAEEVFSYCCLLEPDLRPTAGCTCLSRSLPSRTGSAVIPLSLPAPVSSASPRLLGACSWEFCLGSASLPTSPSLPASSKRWAANWEPCR